MLLNRYVQCKKTKLPKVINARLIPRTKSTELVKLCGRFHEGIRFDLHLKQFKIVPFAQPDVTNIDGPSCILERNLESRTLIQSDSGKDKNTVKMMQPGRMKLSISEGRCASHSSICDERNEVCHC